MIELIRTNSENADFRRLVSRLDKELAVRDGEEHGFYAQFNKIDAIRCVVLAFDENQAVGCGAIKDFAPSEMEIKRMYVPEDKRGRGVASLILRELEKWAKEQGCRRCVLETGYKQPEAIALYKKNGYRQIPNYGQYVGMENSVCFAKEIS